MAQCISPFRKRGETIDLPCGKCYECKQRRAAGWSFRLTKEAEVSTSAFFITLTYSGKNMVLTKKGLRTIEKTEVQKFLKRLRKTQTNKLKYYAVGEYGTNSQRPHYHIIIFNLELEKILTKTEYKMVLNKQIQLNGKTPMHIKEWKQGHITIGEVNSASVNYTLKYITKTGKIPLNEQDDRNPHFSLMSKKLGKNYLTPQMVKWHKADINNRMYCNIMDGKKIAMPRYYKEKIYTKHQRQVYGALQQQNCGKLSNEDLAYLDQIRINKTKQLGKNIKPDVL